LFFHFFGKHSFSKEFDLNQLWILTNCGLQIQTTQNSHTQAVAKPSTNLHGFGDIKVYLQHNGVFRKKNAFQYGIYAVAEMVKRSKEKKERKRAED